MDNFKAFRIRQNDSAIQSGFETVSLDDLTVGDVVIKAIYSGINYKDALAATGKGKILRQYPLNGGIDLSGIVTNSSDPRFIAGQPVLVVGAGLSEYLDGGYAEYCRVPARCVVPLPDGLSLFEAMALGTAGFTAALAVTRIEDIGQDKYLGPVVVTGATGGVGSIAIDILSSRGYEVVAYTGKSDKHDYLKSIGASSILDRQSVNFGSKPLEKAQWGAAIDNVGGETLAWLTRTIKPWGNIASIGLAGGTKLETTVMPFILRGVSLIGINSIEMPVAVRDQVWKSLGSDMKPHFFDKIVSRVIDFDELPNVFSDYIESANTGRTVIRIGVE